MVTYGFDSPDETYQAGRQITGTASDARAAGARLLSALDAAVGTGDAVVDAAIKDLRTDLVTPVNRMSHDVERLGANTSKGATTGVTTSNETTAAQKTSAGLNREVNTSGGRPIMGR
ncbi:hypothetical protein KV097_04580 [Mumia sp. zg.B17]|uniref:hypothetical protein n=1 Tax=Mumia sp. zg.B17 TaxID=2855446 RepID=UPI001C6DE147|nr:hypothetical protein [Mumia sp. zg.B17]MBW9205210.1 hypothetical protein [Mumia sp. zg.B17]